MLNMNKMLTLIAPNYYQKHIKRSLWGWLNTVFNKVDPKRVEEAGPDRAAAEWLLRCGASVKWKNFDRWQTDYNTLPVANLGMYKIEEIDGTDSTIMHIGFPHLKGLKELRKIIIKNNGYLDDEALHMLKYVKDTLCHLEIIECIGVTDNGIQSLGQLEKLKFLKLHDLPSVKDREKCLDLLTSQLTNCTIEWTVTRPKSLI